MKYIKTYELFQDFESEDYVIALPTYIDDGVKWSEKRDFVTTNVGLVVDSTRKMIKIEYKTNTNNRYILDKRNQLVTYKKYFRLATPEEIENQKMKDTAINYNL